MSICRRLGALIVLAACAAPARAQTGSAYTRNQRGMDETFRLDVGGFFQKFATDVRVGDALGGAGTDVSLESTLGLPDTGTNLRVDGTWRLGPRAGLQLGYRRASRSGTNAIVQDVTFGDQTYHVGARVDTSVRRDVGELYLSYALVNGGDAEFALMLGVSAFSERVSVVASGSAAGPGGGSATQAEERNVFAPVPAVGATFRYALYPRVFAWGKVKGVTGTVSGYHGSMLIWSAGLDWYLTKNVGIGGGYESERIAFERREARRVDLDETVRGPVAYLSIAF